MKLMQNHGRTDSLVPPLRQLKTTLRKSAERAQRLADAFGQTAPTMPSPPGKALTNMPAKR